MRNNYLVLVGCCLLSVFLGPRAQAQTNFQPGYVLPLTGDPLRGEVDARDGRASAQRCRFRATAQAEVVTYQPTGLRGYGLRAGGKQYRALAVAAGPAPARPYFLEVLVDGSASLYFLRDADQHEFYYVASPQLPVTELKHAVERVVRDGRVYSEERNDFRVTLAAALAGCAAAQSPLPRLPFQESALQQVVNLYNACQGGAAPQSRPAAPAAHVTLGLLAGVVRQRLSYSGFPYDAQPELTTGNTGYAVGPMAHFHLNRISRKLSLTLALLYESEKFELRATNLGQPAGSYARSRFDLAYLRLPVLFRYTYPRGRVAPLVEAGFTFAYAVQRDNAFDFVSAAGQATQAQVLLNNKTFRPLELGLGAGLGLSTRSPGGRALAFLVRAEASNGFSDAIEVGATVLRVYGLLSYDLTK